jgi:site-specific DNA-methyltransferase (adenine-specific)
MIRLLQGDCIEMMKTLPDKSVDAIITDPPYGTTACKWDTVIPLEPMWEQLKRIIKPNGAIVLFGVQPFMSTLIVSNIKMFKYTWYWRKDTKSNFPQANHQPLNNIEIIAVFSNGYARNFPKNSKKTNDIMIYNPQMSDGIGYKIPKITKATEIFLINNKNGVYKHKEKDTTKRFPFVSLHFKTERGKHPTQKPVAMMEYLIKTYTNEGETVLDFTAGSGTLGVAAINTNRNAILIEREHEYCEIIKKRIAEAEKNKANNLFAGE